jgi:hypothetical protein
VTAEKATRQGTLGKVVIELLQERCDYTIFNLTSTSTFLLEGANIQNIVIMKKQFYFRKLYFLLEEGRVRKNSSKFLKI